MYHDEHVHISKLLLTNNYVLHHSNPVPPSNHEWRSSWISWNRQNGNYQGSRESSRDHGLRVQLLWADGLQGTMYIQYEDKVTRNWTWDRTNAYSHLKINIRPSNWFYMLHVHMYSWELPSQDKHPRWNPDCVTQCWSRVKIFNEAWNWNRLDKINELYIQCHVPCLCYTVKFAMGINSPVSIICFWSLFGGVYYYLPNIM